MKDYIEEDNIFNFVGLEYKAVTVDHDIHNPFYKCALCDLNNNGKKHCLSNLCKCGSCFGWDRHDGKDVIFVLANGASKEVADEILKMKRELAQAHELHNENERLKERNAKLVEANHKLLRQNMQFEAQITTIYANINRAIKKEIYKYMDKEK